MLKNYIKIAYRSLWKHKLYTGLSIIGLSIGIACCMVLFQFITFHLSYDQYHSQADNIFKVVTDLYLPDGSVEYDPGAPVALGQTLEGVAKIKDYAILLKDRSFTVSVSQNENFKTRIFSENENIAFTNQQWFQLFDYIWEEGDDKSALNEPFTAVITKKLSSKYFGKSDPIGRTIKLDSKHEVKITGLIEDYPANTANKIDMFLSLSSIKYFYPEIEISMNNNWDWISSSTSLFILSYEGASKAGIEEEIARLTKKHMGDLAQVYRFHLQPLDEVHFEGRYGGVIEESLMIILATIGLLLILIASLNFINLATAQGAKRAKEVGIRKILGTPKSGIFWQFIVETSGIALGAFILAIIWVNLFIPFLNDWLQIAVPIDFFQDFELLLVFIFFLFCLVLIAGIYPAAILSRFNPRDGLKGIVNKNQNAPRSWKFLIVGQNIIAQALIICTLVIAVQISYLETADLGFNSDAIIMVPIPDQNKSKMNYLGDQLAAHSNIKNLSFCFRPPFSDWVGGGSVRFNDRDWEKFPVRSRTGDVNYLNTFDIQIVAGRNLQESDSIKEFLVNEQFLEKLGLNDPREALGNTLIAGEFSEQSGQIVGVVKDFHSNSLHHLIEPILITTEQSTYDFVAIKINPKKISQTIKTVQEEWSAVYSENVFEYRFLDSQIAKAYQNEKLVSKLIRSSALISIFLSCLGLFGLISLLTIQRTKEIGIRKVLGSSVFKIVLLLSKDFLQLLIVALIIASPIAGWVMNQYLQNFSYHIEIEWWMFALGGFLSVTIALVTISWQSISAALTNPVDSLKNE